MHSGNLVLEVEHVDEFVTLGILLLLRNTLREYLRILVQIKNWVITQRFAIETVGTRLVNAYPATLIFVGNLRLLNEG